MDNKKALSLLCPIYPNGHKDFIPMCLEEMELHSAKNADYARGGNPLGNFERVSAMSKMWGYNLEPYDVALIYLMKQMDAVGRMLGKGDEGQVEGIDGRLLDISIYSKLIRILYKESKDVLEAT